jgi:hypothetical protein
VAWTDAAVKDGLGITAWERQKKDWLGDGTPRRKRGKWGSGEIMFL